MGQIFGDPSKSSLQIIIDKIAKFKVTHSVLKKNFHVFYSFGSFLGLFKGPLTTEFS